VYEVPVEVNGVITLNFILDTGASDVNIPADVALTLYRTGTIRDTDFLPGQTYRLADGSQINSSRFVLRSLKIGRRHITNVAASIGNTSSSLLLGQSFLEKLGVWGIDSQKQVLTMGTKVEKEASTSKQPYIPKNKIRAIPEKVDLDKVFIKSDQLS
jgi:clan AA aspartic protease (TIGR02281 family)